MMVGMILASDADSMLYVGCQDGSLRCINPKGKDSELENYIICKPHQDCVKKITCGKNIEGSILLFTVGNDSLEYLGGNRVTIDGALLLFIQIVAQGSGECIEFQLVFFRN